MRPTDLKEKCRVITLSRSDDARSALASSAPATIPARAAPYPSGRGPAIMDAIMGFRRGSARDAMTVTPSRGCA